MEGNGGLNSSGITIKGDEVSLSFRVEPRTENAGQLGGGSTAPPTTSVPASMAVVPAAEVKKKKRGRPRKYAADGSIVALSPMPISASIPLAGDYAGWKSSSKKKQKLEFCNSGQTAHPASGGFTPHMIAINPGEDIMMKIISFSQQGSRAICILAANGSISNVTLRQPNSSGGTLTYEGRFEILSLTGSFMPSDNNGFTKSRSGGMSVSLAGPDGRVLGGGLAGMLVAAGPVQVVIGSFVTGEEHEQKLDKPKYQSHTISFASPITTNHVSDERYNSNLGLPASFRGNNSVPVNSSTHAFKITDPENIPRFLEKIPESRATN